MAQDIFGNKISKNILGISVEKEKKRQPIAGSQKSQVFDDQNGLCWRCKNRLKLGHTQYHHLKQVSHGGKSKTSNLVALCANCHSEIHKEESAKKIDSEKGKSNSGQDTWTNPLTGRKEKIVRFGF
jgi:5-methylcytosine-specific restriction endonuclease McrA